MSELATRILAQERPAIAEALNLVENARDDARERVHGLLAALRGADQGAIRLGITGPPGAGKSTLCGAMAKEYRRRGLRVALIAVDPSSTRSGGSLLGDRIRTEWDPEDDGLFARSIATGGALGGLAGAVPAATMVLGSAFDIVLIETTGVGQSELDVRDVADIVLLVAQPGSGDALQGLKAGIMEIPDLIVVNKSDLGDVADRSVGELRRSVLAPVLAASALRETGIAPLADAVLAVDCGERKNHRRRGEATWIVSQFRREYGEFGIRALGGAAALHQEVMNQIEAERRAPIFQSLKERFFETLSTQKEDRSP